VGQGGQCDKEGLLGQVGGGWALKIKTFLGPKWLSSNGLMQFYRAQRSLDFQGSNPLPLALIMDLPASKALRRGRVNHLGS
jgi:hypothetical protein